LRDEFTSPTRGVKLPWRQLDSSLRIQRHHLTASVSGIAAGIRTARNALPAGQTNPELLK
jgi:hypothetical protein